AARFVSQSKSVQTCLPCLESATSYQKCVPGWLTVWIWYPASVNKSSTPSEYTPAHWRAAFAKRQAPGPNKMWRDPSLVHCHSFDNVEVAPDPRRCRQHTPKSRLGL